MLVQVKEQASNTAEQAQLDSVLREDMRLNAQDRNPDRKRGLAMRVDQRAVLNAVSTEGKEVLGAAGKGYWEDMQRRYPHMRIDGRPIPSGRSLNERRCRLGKVTHRWRMQAGKMVQVW